MGKGDRKTKKGKIWSSSYGKSRPKKVTKAPVVAKKEEEKKTEEA